MIDYDKTRAYAYTCARNRGANHHEAEDAAQEAMILVWRKRDSYDPSKGLSERTWFNYVARGAVALYWARKIHGNPLIPVEDLPEQSTRYDSTEESGLAAWESAEVRKVIAATLSGNDRKVVERLYLDDAAYQDVCVELGWNQDGSRLRQIRRRALSTLEPRMAYLVG